MKKYTKEQLLKAMVKYNENYTKDESAFRKYDTIEDPAIVAKEQLDYLLSLVEE